MHRDVFIIHAQQDEVVAGEILKFLESQGIHGWWPSRDFPRPIEDEEIYSKALASARIFLVVFSTAANESRQCQLEAARALESEKLIVPFRITSSAPSGHMELLMKRRYAIDALLPPLEKHLEELCRVVKPFANQRSAAKSDASISRTLPARSAILAAPSPPVLREPTGPFQAALKYSPELAIDQSVVIGVIVANQGSRLLESVQVEVRGFGLKSSPFVIPDLSPGTQAQFFIETTLQNEKVKLLHLFVSGYDSFTKFSYRGSFPVRTKSLDKDLTAARPGQKRIDPEPDFTEVTRASMAFHVEAEEAQPGLALSEGFERIDLSLDFAHSLDAESVAKTRLTLSVPFAFQGRSQPGEVLLLERLDDPSPLPHQSFRLSARPNFVLGRSPEEADYLLWFWPRNEIHDAKTLRISKKLCEFAVEGGQCLVRSAAITNVVTVDGIELDTQGIEFSSCALLSLAGNYSIEAELIRPYSSNAPSISNLERWAGQPSTRREVSGLVKFKAVTANALPQQVIWLLSEATFGTSGANGLVFALPGLAEIQGRFHFLHGCFWLENAVDNDAVSIDGHMLKAGTIAPLTHGSLITLGGVRFRPSILS